MISPAYVQEMARYNTWQNKQIAGFLEDMDDEVLRQDRGAFFGSILATLNHILLADVLWLQRLGCDVEESVQRVRNIDDATATGMDWHPFRAEVDALIQTWAETVDDSMLANNLDWSSRVMGQSFTHPYALCVVHFFNHQTHHRGQVHAMLTATGSKAPVSDVVFMPEDA